MQHLHTSREPTIAKLEESTHTIARRTAQIIRAGLDLFAIPHE
jgi:hypothetical protein